MYICGIILVPGFESVDFVAGGRTHNLYEVEAQITCILRYYQDT